MLVRTEDGETIVIVNSFGSISVLSDSKKPIIRKKKRIDWKFGRKKLPFVANLEAQYAVLNGSPISPDKEPTTPILPFVFLRCGWFLQFKK